MSILAPMVRAWTQRLAGRPLRQRMRLLPIGAAVALAAIFLVSVTLGVLDPRSLTTIQTDYYPALRASRDMREMLGDLQNQLQTTVATRDVGQVAASLLIAPPPASEVIDLVGPMYSPRDLASALGAQLGRSLQVVDVPPPARVGALVQAGLPQSFAEEVAELYACFDSGRIRPQGERALTATTTIEETLAAMMAPDL